MIKFATLLILKKIKILEYEVKNIRYEGAVKVKNETTFSQFVNVTTAIVGNTYSGFDATDTIEIDFPSTGLDATQIAEKIQADSVAFSSAKYPNT